MRQSLHTWAIALMMAIAGVCRAASDDYLVVDLSAGVGGSYPISYTNAAPPGGWTNEHKTSKLVMRKLPRGTFLMGSPTNEIGRDASPAGSEDQQSVSLSNDFYIGVFEMTEGQCKRLSTTHLVFSQNSTLAAGSYTNAEAFSIVIGNVLAALNNGTHTNFALPTEAQWEYACRAGSATAYHFGSDTNQLNNYARYGVSAGYSPQAVGLLTPNAYGLYDMYGNVAEVVGKLSAADHWACGGSVQSSAAQCRSASRAVYAYATSSRGGFRLCLTVPLKTYKVTVTNGTAEVASGTNGQVVAIWAHAPSSLNVFDRWTGDTQTVENVTASNTTVRIQESNVALTATYRSAPFTLTVYSGSGSGQYDSGDRVSVEADDPAPGKRFSHWSVVPANAPLGDVFDPLKAATSLTMPPLHTILSAVYEDIPTYRLTVNGGTGGGTYTNGQEVTIYASPPPEHFTFLWAGDTAALADPSRWITTLSMPASDITVTATYPPVVYTLTVNGGTGGGAYTNGQAVTVAATNRPSAQHAFYRWSGDTNGVANVYAATTAVTVAGAATLTPTYRPLPVPANTYLIVDLAASQVSDAVSYLDAPPADGWTAEYRASRLVLSKVPGGSFQMGSSGETTRTDEPSHSVTLTQGFYLGLFEVTQEQWSRVSGSWPSRYTNATDRATHPVERVSYSTIRGASNGVKWPSSSAVDSGSFMGQLRTKTGDANFDLPTEAQWEYACRAGTTGMYSADTLGDVAFYAANSGGHTWEVGQQPPNDWGFYDMHGNVAEFCLDWYAGAYSTTNQTDPKGATSSPSTRRITRGGGCLSDADACRSAARGNLLVTNASYNAGLRLARPLGKAYALTVVHGFMTTSGWFVAGTTIPLSAATATGWTFASWQVTPSGSALGSAYRFAARDTLITMPTQAVTVVATYVPTLPVTVTLDAAGGTVSPASLAVGQDGPYGGPDSGSLPTPLRLGYAFQGWWTEPGGTGAEVTGATLVTASVAHTLYAHWSLIPNQPPVFTKRAPTNAVVTVNEGATLALSVTASDLTDPDAARRGMSNVTWFVDGLLTLTTRTGAPGAIASALSYRPSATLVSGAATRDVQIRAVALDRLGGTSETNWTVTVVNVPASQTITFRALPITALGGTNFNPGATASSGLPVSYASSNDSVAQIADGLIRIVGAGAAIITASQPGNFDFKAAAPVRQTLTVKASLTAEVPSGGGTVLGAGLYTSGTRVTLTAKPSSGYTFLRWEDGTQVATRTLTVAGSNITVLAWFGSTAGVPPPAVGNPGPQQATVGAFFRLPLDVQSESLPTVTLSNLPSGLRYNAATKTVEGVPTVSVTNRLVSVRAVNVSAVPVTETFAITVTTLPAWAQGTFSGLCTLWVSTGWDAPALTEMTVTSLGKISGKFSASGTNYTFTAGSYTNGDVFTFATVAAAGKAKIPMVVAVTHPDIYPGGPAALGTAEFRLDGAPESDAPYTLWRSVWKDADMAAAATNYTGYYTATLPGFADFGSGYLLLTVDKVGGVKTTGKLADGTAVSLSQTLIVDVTGRVFVLVHTAPSAYKGGCFLGAAEFVRQEAHATILRELESGSYLWESRNPQATGNYAAGGFSRSVGVVGGWYDTVGNLYRYYAGRVLEVDTVGGPVPVLTVGTNRYESACWDPDGLTLTVVTNRSGVMTGLAAPRAGTPVSVNGAYNYAGTTNAVGLTVALTRATGVFKGSFKAWFDYGATHTYKTVAYEGALTPEREATGDSVEGRGFFLWPDTSSYLNPQGRAVVYPFSWSYDFQLLMQ